MDKQKQIEEMTRDLYGIQTYAYMEIYPCKQKQPNEIVAEHLVRKGWIKPDENAVVLTEEELKEKIDCCNVSMIHHDDDGKRYIEYENYKDFTDRLGKRIQQLKEQLKQTRKETAEKFARLVEFHSVSTRDANGREIFTISELCLKEILHEEFGIPYDEIAKEITGEQYVECHECKHKWDCERTYLHGCTDGEKWD